MNKIKALFLLCFIVVGVWHLEKLYTRMRDRTANYVDVDKVSGNVFYNNVVFDAGDCVNVGFAKGFLYCVAPCTTTTGGTNGPVYKCISVGNSASGTSAQ